MEIEIKKAEEGSISELMQIVSKLRDPNNGCPWDLEQTHKSLIPYVLEEAHEVAEAIREENSNNLKEELGDLLLQVILQSQIASEENTFNLNDVMKEIAKKLIRRHPHVFSNQKLNSAEEVNTQWEKIKLSENTSNNSSSPISDRLKKKIRSQTAITGAMVISKQVSKIGFDWETENELWEKFYEEIHELKQEIKNKNFKNAQTELGDVLFTLINVGRWYKMNPDEGLRETNKKFLERFAYMESKTHDGLTKKSKKAFESMWQEAKQYIGEGRASNN